MMDRSETTEGAPAPFAIPRLDLSRIRPNDDPTETARGGFKITIVGKPGLGKSTLIKKIIHSKRFLIPTAVVFSGSEEANGFYSGMFPSCYIYDEYDPKVLEKIFERQVCAKKHKIPNPWILVIFDDCMHDTRQFSSETMLKLFKNGRHYNILAIFTNQYVLDFKPMLRSLLDGIFLFREQNRATLDRLYYNFGGMIPSRAEFVEVLETATREPYSCLYIDNASCNTKPWQDCLYWYRAAPVADFAFGCELYRKGNDPAGRRQQTEDEDRKGKKER